MHGYIVYMYRESEKSSPRNKNTGLNKYLNSSTARIMNATLQEYYVICIFLMGDKRFGHNFLSQILVNQPSAELVLSFSSIW